MSADLQFILVCVLIVVLPAIATRNGWVPGMVLSSFLVLAIPVRFGFEPWTALASGLLLFLLVALIYFSGKKDIFRTGSGTELKKWRVLARPFALLFIPIHIIAGHRNLLYLLGFLAIVFIATDLYRLIARKEIPLLFKKTEIRRFSSMTSFVVGVFILFLLFPEEISYLCLGFIIFGDMAAKITGLGFGRTKIVHNRTLEGSLGFLTGYLYPGYLITSLCGFEFSYLLAGSVFATLAELFSFNMDDNFTVGILTGGCLTALKYFSVI